jgi:hypothetical protein
MMRLWFVFAFVDSKEHFMQTAVHYTGYATTEYTERVVMIQPIDG